MRWKKFRLKTTTAAEDLVIDALAHGKPCIASASTPWRELRDRGCGWWVSNEPQPLAEAIGEMAAAGDLRRRAQGRCERATRLLGRPKPQFALVVRERSRRVSRRGPLRPLDSADLAFRHDAGNRKRLPGRE